MPPDAQEKPFICTRAEQRMRKTKTSYAMRPGGQSSMSVVPVSLSSVHCLLSVDAVDEAVLKEVEDSELISSHDIRVGLQFHLGPDSF